ncbi:Uncharacterised protein [uncultured archaeon]|nr:Uncharacterised protein [uncultured archaeon]
MKKKGEGALGMSFSMIFSIILIIFFVAAAFMAIRYFLKLQSCARVGDFASELQNKVTEAWDSQKSSYELKSVLPSNIEYVCFADLSKELRGEKQAVLDELEFFQGGFDSNMVLYPKGNTCDMPVHKINHLDLPKITKTKNPYCIKVNKGMVIVKIEKGFTDRLVTVSG